MIFFIIFLWISNVIDNERGIMITILIVILDALSDIICTFGTLDILLLLLLCCVHYEYS